MTEKDIDGLLNHAPSALKHIVTGWFYLTDGISEPSTNLETEGIVLDFDIGKRNVQEYKNIALLKHLQERAAAKGIEVFNRSPSLIHDLRSSAATLLTKG